METLLCAIEVAFDGVPVPDEAHRTLFQAEAADSYERCDRSRDHLGRWQDLPDSHLLACQWALAHLDAQGIHYYLPAVMSFALRLRAADQPWPWLIESLNFQLSVRPEDDLRGYMRRRFSLLDPAQRAAVAAYVQVAVDEEPTRAAWTRVVDFDAANTPGDWFNEQWPPRDRPPIHRVVAAVRGAFPAGDALAGQLLAVLLDPSEGDQAGSPLSELEERLRPDLRPDRIADHQAGLARLDPAQRRAVALFVHRCSRYSVTRAAWARLSRRESVSPLGDWLSALYSRDTD